MEGGWSRRGARSAFWRSVEIWWFFLRLGVGELRLRRVTDEAAKARRRVVLAGRLKRGLLALGPTFIKLGQLLSTRIDVLPREYIEELVDLQDRVPGFSGADAVASVERELGQPLPLLFDTFDEVPIAAASLGQVHRATLDGEDLAVKVQRAGLRELFDVDLKNLRALARLLDRVDPKTDGAQRNWLGIFEESAALLYEEIDYTREAANSERMRDNFADTRWVKVPAVYWERTSEAVLTMEYVEGVKINDYAAMDAMGLDRKLVARRAAQSFLSQLLRHGFFHDDCHPGNLHVDAQYGGRLIYYDFGMCSSISPSVRQGFINTVFAIYEGTPQDFCDGLAAMGILRPTADRVSVEKIGRYFISAFRTSLSAGNVRKSADEKRSELVARLTSIGDELLAVGEDQPFVFPPVFTFVFRAFTTLEGVGKGLDPSYDLTLLAAPYLKELVDLKDGSAALTVVKSGLKKVGWRPIDIEETVTAPRKLAYVERTLRRMEEGELRLRVRVLESERAFQRMRVVEGNMAVALVAATLCQLAVIYTTSGGGYVLRARALWVAAGLAAARLAAGLLKLRALDARLARYTTKR
ncbi:hypothetical protein BU14_0396s0011 [Porphyra umbilicalis]|uniref:ABC1 atypical kinase-like domain-containing protein n=1 Tax=Porphyra umbilicalis TaxID=2786 RepID=A0A1X6NWC1_PORUM|nr:hypothetical protein BU14_0396s0011 [Porphyra umbilicalis]|eukprot:OSX72908.1 hypothetical protein BU14_0396s0011 [Porphyra umbilicalis]